MPQQLILSVHNNIVSNKFQTCFYEKRRNENQNLQGQLQKIIELILVGYVNDINIIMGTIMYQIKYNSNQTDRKKEIIGDLQSLIYAWIHI